MRWGHYEYTPVSEKRAAAKMNLERLRKKDPDISPITIEGRKIVTTWWGKAWTENLESYADYANRIGRGRSYVRNGMVLDLKISPGVIGAQVSGSRRNPYVVRIDIDKLPESRWNSIVEQIGRRISNAAELVEGKFPEDLKEIFLRQGSGLFPSPKEIHMECSCPDWAYMCKHIAAVLYGTGTRLDQDPLLFFTLRGIDCSDLLKKSIDDKMNSMLKNAGKKTARVMDGADIEELFGLKTEQAQGEQAPRPPRGRAKKQK
ncbi:MAG: SWIM zinc finger family protein [Synergistaceae bacterium]|jgi:uncharacterized Zn finger protein|nr:SWIM zinc finger family protein [Synergistaceae bacterium]